MKIALCLSGYFDSFKDGSSTGQDGYEYIKKGDEITVRYWLYNIK